MTHRGLMYNVFDFFLIVFFAYFYTALVFNPDELAENIKKGGGFIPGIRPGKKTSEFFAYLLNRIVLVGAIYLAALAILPNIILSVFPSTVTLSTLLSGTSLLDYGWGCIRSGCSDWNLILLNIDMKDSWLLGV